MRSEYQAEAGRLRVSIIITNYNYGPFLREAIDSALDQSYANADVVVVDDGSTDHSREIIRGYGERVVAVLKDNGGQASAFNAGFARSTGDVLCFLDSDDLFLREKVARVVQVFDDHPDIGWCFHPLKVVETRSGALLRIAPPGRTRPCDFRAQLQKGRLRFGAPATSGICFTRSLLQCILPMPESKSVSTSDQYLKYSAMALSKGYFLSEALSLLRIHGNNAYSLRDDRQHLAGRINILTAYWMRVKHPKLIRFTHKLFARGLSNYWLAGSVEAQYQDVVDAYMATLSPARRLSIMLRAWYLYSRARIKQLHYHLTDPAMHGIRRYP